MIGLTTRWRCGRKFQHSTFAALPCGLRRAHHLSLQSEKMMEFARSSFFPGPGHFTRFNGRARYTESSGTRRAAIDRLDRIATLLDIAFFVPGTNVRFGVDAILRLIPGVGDAAASLLSCYLLYEARRLGVPPLILARMAGNVALEGLIGTVPLLGDAFDVFFRANRRNLSLLRRHFERHG